MWGSQWQVDSLPGCLSCCELRGPTVLESALPGTILLRGASWGLLLAALSEAAHSHDRGAG